MPDEAEKEQPLTKGGENDCSSGPIKNRGCTDVLCLIVFIANWVLWFALLIWAFTAGSPGRLTAQRDYKGAYCGYDDNFHKNAKNAWRFDYDGYEKSMYTMNVHAANEPNLATVLCSLSVQTAIGLHSDPDTTAIYDLQCSPDAMATNALADAKAKMAAAADPANAVSSSGDSLNQMDKYFHRVCVKSCEDVSSWASFSNFPNLYIAAQTGSGAGLERTYFYHPPPNTRYYNVAQELWRLTNADGAAIDSVKTSLNLALLSFKFPSLPESLCPEAPEYCVPMPGMAYTDVVNFCMLKFSSGAVSAAGDAAASAATDALGNGLASAAGGDVSTAIGDVSTAWPVFIIMFFISLCVGFAFMICLRFAVGIMVWGALVVVLCILLGGGIYYLTLASCEMKTTPAGETAIEGGGTTTMSPYTAKDYESCEEKDPAARDQYEVFAYIFFVIAGIYLLLLLCNLSRIQLGIAVNKVAAKFMYQTKTILFVPVIQIGVCMVWWTIWLVGALFVLSTIDPEGNAFTGEPPSGAYTKEDADGSFFTAGKCTSTYPSGFTFLDPFTSYKLVPADGVFNNEKTGMTYYHEVASPTDRSCFFTSAGKEDDSDCFRCALPRVQIVSVQFAYYFFSLLWVNAFIVAVGQTTVAGAVAIWYFTANDKKGQSSSVRPAFKNCFRFHLGSLALGSFILAVVQFIKWVLRYIQKQAEQQKNYILAKIAGALACCVQCFERFIKFLNKNAYIQIAILGKNFCRSAWAAFCLILRNMGRIGVLATIGSGVAVIGITFITAFTVFIGYFILMAMYEEDISSPIMCCLLIFMIGFMIAKLFMTVFALAVDTTLQCFCADEELNKGANDYTPDELKGFLKDPNAKRGCCG